MRFSNWYSISIFLVLTTFVVTIGVFFIKTNNICLSCIVSKKASDCDQFKKTAVAIGKQQNDIDNAKLQSDNPNPLQRVAENYNLRANQYEKNAETWLSIKFQEPKSKQIQNSFVEGYKLLAEGHRDEVKALKLKPLQTKGEIRGRVSSPQLPDVKGQKKIQEATAELEKYCPYVYDKVFDQLGLWKNEDLKQSKVAYTPTQESFP